VEVIDLENLDEALEQNFLLLEKGDHIQMLMDTLSKEKIFITHLKQENKQLNDKQDLMELQMLKLKRQSDKEHYVTLIPVE